MNQYSELSLKNDNSGVTPVIGIILMVAVTIILAASLGLLFFSTDTNYLQKPPQSAFKTSTCMGISDDSKELNVPVIELHKVAGDMLSQEYKEGEHSGIEWTRIYLFDPNGNRYEVNNSVTMEGAEIDTGETFYIFHYDHGDGNYWITNDEDRITKLSDPDGDDWGGGVEHFKPPGKWRILIIEDKKNLVLVDTTVMIPDN